jgi:hypothetical protein
MSASDHLHPDQLKMFMSPREIGNYVDQYGDLGEGVRGLQHDKQGAYKVRDAKTSGMYDSIATDGVKKPVEISHFEDNAGWGSYRGQTVLVNGHHRVFSQAQADPDRLIPVLHQLDWMGGGVGAAFPTRENQDSDPLGLSTERKSTPEGWHKIRP